jgi:hypothetical protein
MFLSSQGVLQDLHHWGQYETASPLEKKWIPAEIVYPLPRANLMPYYLHPEKRNRGLAAW